MAAGRSIKTSATRSAPSRRHHVRSLAGCSCSLWSSSIYLHRTPREPRKQTRHTLTKRGQTRAVRQHVTCHADTTHNQTNHVNRGQASSTHRPAVHTQQYARARTHTHTAHRACHTPHSNAGRHRRHTRIRRLRFTQYNETTQFSLALTPHDAPRPLPRATLRTLALTGSTRTTAAGNGEATKCNCHAVRKR